MSEEQLLDMLRMEERIKKRMMDCYEECSHMIAVASSDFRFYESIQVRTAIAKMVIIKIVQSENDLFQWTKEYYAKYSEAAPKESAD